MYMYIYIHHSQEHQSKLDSVRKIDLTNADQMSLANKYYARNFECINFFLAKCVLPQETQQYRSVKCMYVVLCVCMYPDYAGVHHVHMHI